MKNKKSKSKKENRNPIKSKGYRDGEGQSYFKDTKFT